MKNKSKADILSDRKELFSIWEYELSMGGQYFIDSATTGHFHGL